ARLADTREQLRRGPPHWSARSIAAVSVSPYSSRLNSAWLPAIAAWAASRRRCPRSPLVGFLDASPGMRRGSIRSKWLVVSARKHTFGLDRSDLRPDESTTNIGRFKSRNRLHPRAHRPAVVDTGRA